MTNVLYLHNRQSLDRHQNSIMASLAHRLEVAKANNNVYLVALLEQEKLEQEKQQSAPKATAGVARSPRHSWNLTRYIRNVLFGGSELQVSEVVDGRDRWWVASDPRTGQFVYADSEAELRLWIEENYQGR